MREQELYQHLKDNHWSDLTTSSEEYDKYDCVSDEHHLFIELKSRKTHYPDLLIEKAKFDYLLEKAASLGYTPMYINSTPEGVWAFDLTNNPYQIEWQEKWLPRSTEFANRLNRMKIVGFLKLEWGTKLL